MTDSSDSVRSVRWQDGTLVLLDQRRLPDEVVHVTCRRTDDVTAAIRAMVVRGAPAIGIAAAYGAAMAAAEREPAAVLDRLANARPTAVNLRWVLARMRPLVEAGAGADRLLDEAQAIHEEDVAANRRMGELGAPYVQPGTAVLTHCNTGSLATGGYGTALGVIRSAWAAGRLTRVYAGETRPWLQGARLTAWELLQDGVPVDLLADGAAAALLRTGTVSCVIVGADRVTANGDVANKIGTYALALAARAHGVRFLVAAPLSTMDFDTPSGGDIPIEHRAAEEVLGFAGHRMAPEGAGAWNPVFDITPAALVDVLVTERGVVERPDRERLESLRSAP